MRHGRESPRTFAFEAGMGVEPTYKSFVSLREIWRSQTDSRTSLRRWAESNRRIVVLQTTPLATWVQRRCHFNPYFFFKISFC